MMLWKIGLLANFVIMVAMLACSVSPVNAKRCRIQPTKEHPTEIDLSPLMISGGDYKVVSRLAPSTYQYVFNICRELQSFTDTICKEGAMICEQKSRSGTGDGVFGYLHNYNLTRVTKSSQGYTAQLTTTGGPCANGGLKKGTINFKCVQGVGPAPHVTQETVIGGCTVVIEFPSKHACPQHVNSTELEEESNSPPRKLVLP